MIDKFKKQIELFPVYTIVLIFLGYWNLYTYYKHFKIEIYKYVTTSELLLSFLPISIYIFYALCIVLLFISIPMLGFIRDFKAVDKLQNENPNIKISIKTGGNNNDEFLEQFNFFRLIKRLFDKQHYKGFSKVRQVWMFIIGLINIIMTLLAVIFFIVSMCYPFYLLMYNQIGIYEYWNFVVFGLVIFFLIIFNLSNSIFAKIPQQKIKNIYSNIFNVILVTSIVILFIMYNNYRKAYKVLNNTPIEEVSFKIDSTKYSTNDSILFIGQTQNYLFLKEAKKENILIFNKNNIKLLSIRDLD